MDDITRRLVAQNAGNTALIQAMLTLHLGSVPRKTAAAFIQSLKAQTNDTASLTGAFKGDEVRSEALADVAIQMQQHVAELLDSAFALAWPAPPQ